MRDEKLHAVVACFEARFGPLLEVAMSKKCMPLWREAHFKVKMLKNTTCSDHFWKFRARFAWQVRGIVHLVKSEQNGGVCSISKNEGRRGAFEECRALIS